MYSTVDKLTALHYQSQVKWFISTLLTGDKSGIELCCHAVIKMKLFCFFFVHTPNAKEEIMPF